MRCVHGSRVVYVGCGQLCDMFSQGYVQMGDCYSCLVSCAVIIAKESSMYIMNPNGGVSSLLYAILFFA